MQEHNEIIPAEDSLDNFPNISYTKMQSELNVEFTDLEAGYNAAKAKRVRQWAEYGFQPYGNEKNGASSIVDSTIFNTIEWMIPTLIQPLVQTDKIAELIPEGADVKTLLYSGVFEQLLTFQLKKKQNLYQILYDDIKTFLVGGSSFLKLTWCEKDKTMGEAAGRPKWTHINPEQMRYNWTAKTFEESHVVCEEEDWSRTDIEKKMRGQKGIIPKALDKVLMSRGRSIQKDRLRDEKTDDKNYVGEMTSARPKALDLFLRREHWTLYDVDGSGKASPVLAVFLDDVMVQVIKNPYDFQTPPYAMSECIRDPLGNPAEGWSSSLSDIQKFRTGLLRMLSDNLNAQQNGIYEVDRTQVDEIGMQLIRHAPQGSRVPIPVRRPGSINPITPAPIAQHAFTAWEMLAVEGENRSGNTRYSQGLDSSSLNQTATGIVTITQRSEMRLWEISKRYVETCFKKMIRMTMALNQQKLEPMDLKLMFNVDIHDENLKQIAKEEGARSDFKAHEWVHLNKKDIGGFYTVDIDVMVGSDRQDKINNLLNYMQYVAPYVGQAVPEGVITYVAVELADLMGLQEIKGLMKDSYVGTRGVNVPRELYEGSGAPTTGGPPPSTGANAELGQISAQANGIPGI